jgi:hypothetical protein
MAKRERHFLFHGELSDMPGRNESWDEYVKYLGDNRWELITESTDFLGVSAADPVRERFNTGQMVRWAIDRDSEIENEEGDDEVGDADPDDDEAEESYPSRTFGPRCERLDEIAATEGAAYCLACLAGWRGGSWPPVKRVPVLRILDVTGVKQRGVWIRIYHSVFTVNTNRGPAYLYPPGADLRARLNFVAESSMSPGRIVNVPKRLMPKIEALKPAFDALCER